MASSISISYGSESLYYVSANWSGLGSTAWVGVFVEDINANGSSNGYYCRSIEQGASGSFYQQFTTSSTYSSYTRHVYLKLGSSRFATVGNRYSKSSIDNYTTLASDYDSYTPPVLTTYGVYYYWGNGPYNNSLISSLTDEAELSASSYSTTIASNPLSYPYYVDTGGYRYYFNGWNTALGGSGISYSAGESKTLYRSDPKLYLYAQWSSYPLTTFTLEWNWGRANSYRYIGDDSITSTASSVTFSVPQAPADYRDVGTTRYTFSHWIDDDGNSYNPGDSIRVYSSSPDQNLTAVWTTSTIYNYRVHYDANGGSGTTPTDWTLTSTTEPYTYTLITGWTGLTRNGYTFVGWNEVPNNNDQVQSRVVLDATNYEKTVYAIWHLNWTDINLFAWTNNDANLIVPGNDIATYITASKWNSIYDKVNECLQKDGSATHTYTGVTSGSRITAAAMNNLLDFMDSYIYSTVSRSSCPADVSVGEAITAAIMAGTVSLKQFVNDFVTHINNKHHSSS